MEVLILDNKHLSCKMQELRHKFSRSQLRVIQLRLIEDRIKSYHGEGTTCLDFQLLALLSASLTPLVLPLIGSGETRIITSIYITLSLPLVWIEFN